jgi:hypothetical protein
MARKRKDDTVNNEQNNIVEETKTSTPVCDVKKFRVKDIEGNTADFEDLESMARDLDLNLGICYKYLDNPKSFMGLKIYTIKK